VAIEHERLGKETGVNNTAALIVVADGGKLILDGGEIRKNIKNGSQAAAVYMNAWDDNVTGGEAYFIMKQGKITENTLNYNSRDSFGNAAGIGMNGKSFFVMHGGEISNNETIYAVNDSTWGRLVAVGIGGAGSITNAGSVNNVSMSTHIYITGGEISGNAFTSTGTSFPFNARVTAAAIYNCGTLQKTGGIIRNNTNDVSTSASAERVNGVAVQRTFGASAGLGNIMYRDGEIGEDMMLFAQGTRRANGTASGNASDADGRPNDNMIMPAFVPNNWQN